MKFATIIWGIKKQNHLQSKEKIIWLQSSSSLLDRTILSIEGNVWTEISIENHLDS